MRYALALPRTSGIYRILNTITHQFYIGSAKNLQTRRSTHFRELKLNKHRNPRLQHSYNKYGVSAFCFEIVEHVSNASNLISREQYYLDTLKPEYNILLIAGSRLGSRASEASKRKMSESAKKRGATTTGYKFSDESKTLMSLAKKGKPSPKKGTTASEASKRKMSKAHKDKPLNEKQLAGGFQKGHVPYNKGKKGSEYLSNDALINMSNAGKKRTPWNKGKKGLQAAHNKDIPMSEASKIKLSESQKKRFENPEVRAKSSQTWFVKGEPSIYKFTEEDRAKGREARKGKKRKPHSEATKAKMSATQKDRPSKFKGIPRDPKIIAKTVETKRLRKLQKNGNQDTLWDSV